MRQTISASRGVNRENGRLPDMSCAAGSGPVPAWITAPISATHKAAGRPERGEFAYNGASNRGVQTEGPIGGVRSPYERIRRPAAQGDLPQLPGRRRSEE